MSLCISTIHIRFLGKISGQGGIFIDAQSKLFLLIRGNLKENVSYLELESLDRNKKLLRAVVSHRTLEFRRDLWRSSGPTSQLKWGQLQQSAQDHVQLGSEITDS